jgi:FkbM family methyltransferase
MAQVPTLTELLAVLGINLPAMPEEPEGESAWYEWINRGQVYAEVVRLWQMQLRNADESTKEVVDLLLQHLSRNEQQHPWDRWIAGSVHHEVKRVALPERWEPCINDLKNSPLAPAQILGAILILAEAQQLAGSIHGAKRLLNDDEISLDSASEICFQLVSRFNTTWRMDESSSCAESYLNCIDLHHELTRLLRAAVDAKEACPKHSGARPEVPEAKVSILSSFQRLLAILGDDDQWTGVPKSEALRRLKQEGPEAMLHFLEQSLPLTVPAMAREGSARLIASHMLARNNRWDEAETLHGQAVSRLTDYHSVEKKRTLELEILRSETELLSRELSLALNHGSLQASPTAPASAASDDHEHCTQLSRSQLGQDLWVLEQLGWKRGGFFVEFGATDGVLLSNSWLLEKHFSWNGICAEPNPRLFERLKQNRTCKLSPACVYRSSGEKMRFVLADAYGGLEDLGQDDEHADKRRAYAAAGEVLDITTTSLMDLLDQQAAPAVIDYLSIDTEGSELSILEGVDWGRYQFRCITVEHNFTEQRQSIKKLLEDQGYERREERWDDWYWKQIS